MRVTKDLAELCALLIDEIYGELPSRIFAVLLNRGRSSLVQLGQYTSMTPRQIRHGLAVLIQQNLLYHYVDAATKTATYEANPEPAYNLIRTGKILEMVESAHGAAVKDVMQSLILLGHTRVSDLKVAYEQKIKRSTEAPHLASADMDMDGEAASDVKKTNLPPVRSVAHLNSIICRLAEAELIDVVHGLTFVSPEDIQKDVEERVMRVKFPAGVKGGKGKLEFEEAVAVELCKIRRESKSLKRKLDESGGAGAKRRKLLNGSGANGVNGVNGDHEDVVDPVLDPQQVIRVNYEKCVVELRNRRLVQFASEMIGDTTSYIYGTVLRQLTKKVSRCHIDPRIDTGDMGDEDGTRQPVVTTMEILDNLPTTIDPSIGLAKVSRSRINKHSAEAVHPNPLNHHKTPFLNGGDDEEGDDDDESDVGMNGDHLSEGESDREAKPALNGTAGTVRFAEPARKESRVDMLRQHLYLLAENQIPFIRQCAEGQWTVDFAILVQHLREAELDTVIERTAGRQGLRLVRILRKKGKLDEKALPNISLMKKSDVQHKMLEMEVAGFVDIQEVPRDNSRTANRTIFLWYTDTDRCIQTLLNNTYKTGTRFLQRLAMHRRKEKDVLFLTKRTDVKGREKDMMHKEYYDRFAKLLEIERKLLGHMMRMDEMVAVLRDY